MNEQKRIPLISVIIPVYNIESYIDACIKSVVNQSYDNLEILLIDDGSADKSGTLCDAWKRKDGRIKVIHKENGGLSSARNVGLEVSKGDYISFVDGDDIISEEYISYLYNIISSDEEYDIAICSAYNIYLDSKFLNNDDAYMLEDSVLLPDEVIDLYYEGKSIVLSSCFKLYKKDIWKDLRFEKGRIHEDAYAFPYIFQKAHKIVLTHEKLYYYMHRNGSITNNKDNAADIQSNIDYREFLYNYFVSKNNKKYIRLSLHDYCNAIIGGYGFAKEKNYKKDLFRQFRNIYFVETKESNFTRKIKLAVFYIMPGCITVMKKIPGFRNRFYKNICTCVEMIKIIFELIRYKDRILLLGTPEHGNIGDHIIAESEKDMLTNIDSHTIEIPMNIVHSVKQFFKKNDKIAISGGGWMGDVWRRDEDFIRKIISEFTGNKVVIFPQTVCYKNNDSYLNEGIEIYKNHSNLTLCVRDKDSYNFCLKNKFTVSNDQVKLFPDMALLYRVDKIISRKTSHVDMLENDIANEPIAKKKQYNIGVCFRNDRESSVPIDTRTDILSRLFNKYGNVIYVDTCEVKYISLWKRHKEINNMLDKISKLDLLITDRLHAMIIAALVQTPCIVFDNATHKVRGVYSWINNMDCILLCDCDIDGEAVIDSIDTLINNDKQNRMPDFSQYREALKSLFQ